MTRDASNSGYSETAQALIDQYESIHFEDVHRPVLHAFPAPPARVLDIGAGTGRDAAALARKGHAVTAVEPTPELRAWGQANHPRSIRWIDDTLPQLPQVCALHERFDLILLTAVWMHLDVGEQRDAMHTLAALLAPGGLVSMSLRHGPVPEGRRMFDVSAGEVSELAAGCGLSPLHAVETSDMLGRADVDWTFLVLKMVPGN
jgi:SAM-dependent methyltransferase